MARKSKAVQKELKKAQEKAREIERLLEEAEKEDNAKKEAAEKAIKAIEKESDLFCGVILGRDDLLSVLKLMMETGESIKIPFKLYFNE
jgi:hypothetical protein